MSRLSLRAFLSAILLAACAPEPSTDAPPPEPDPAPQSEPAPPAEPEPTAEVQPEPDPEPEPEVARLPDDTEILPCEEPPPGMACVPGGKFVLGRDEGGEPNEHPAVEVWLQTFYMDLYEVRNFEWKACKKLKACRRGGPLYNDFGRDDQPVTGPNWYAAVEFCGWMGKHLPTEAQWEAAARGPEGELTPFGNEPVTCTNAVIEDDRGRSCGVLKKKEHPKKGRVYIVGSRPPGRYGIYDMAGNAWEWVADWAAKDFAACGEACTGQEPLGICGGEDACRKADQKVVKGGSWYWTTEYAFSTHRRTHYPINEHSNFHHFGWRCAASYEEARKLREQGPGPDRPVFREPAGRETELGLPTSG